MKRKRAHYSKHGKMLDPISHEEFEEALKKLKLKYQAYLVLIYYTGIRVTEALRLKKEDFQVTDRFLYIDVGIRLKTIRKNRKTGKISKGKRTAPLPLDLTLPHLEILVSKVKHTRHGEKVFKFNRATAWRQMDQCGIGYNHRARLSAVTSFLQAGYSLVNIMSWFGIGIRSIDSYIGQVDLEEMGAMKRS